MAPLNEYPAIVKLVIGEYAAFKPSYGQQDGTESGIAGDLTDAGIPHDRIVLAFQHPTQRQHGEYAVG